MDTPNTGLAREDLEDKEKVKRMQSEMLFASDSSTLLPKVHLLFKLQITVPETGRRRQKIAAEFAEALM